MLGATRGTMVTQPFYRFILDADRESCYRFLRLLFSTGDPNTCCLQMAKMNKPPFWAHLEATVAQDLDGTPVCRVVISDFTERRRIEAALQDKTVQLEAVNKELESFSYSVSHDLRAPLRAIDGYSRMILKKEGDRFDEDTRSKFQVIQSNAMKMSQLIHDLLSFAQVARRETSVSTLDMQDIIRDAFQELQRDNPDRVITLEIGNLPQCMADRGLMQQVIVNILSNAVKFTRLREIALIEVSGTFEKNECVYAVKDNGAGFDMAFQDKLFGVFQRLHSDSEYEGTGIGLALVKRIITRHGGRVWAESEPDKGATFYFTIPWGN